MATTDRERVAVFIDYQNCYGAAREAFHDPGNDPSQLGNVHPRALAELLAAKGGRQRDLVHAAVYTGLPDPTLDTKTHRARSRQIVAWQAKGVHVVSRPLRYLPRWMNERPREKGIDVKLGIDAVMMALRGGYDVAVVASCDTDLAPVVEALLELEATRGAPAVEVIAWKGRENRIGVSGKTLTERWIGPKDYAAVKDSTDYNI
jgi:uncharacterized LabA/DUF88 family protein